jgi:hypothetical protein
VAQLPGEDWLMQQIGSEVILFHRHTEAELLRFNPADGDATARAQLAIYMLTELNDEQKSFAHFWSGYFHAHATMTPQSPVQVFQLEDKE